jgi:nucleoside 2-deoxyribosyltransferase
MAGPLTPDSLREMLRGVKDPTETGRLPAKRALDDKGFIAIKDVQGKARPFGSLMASKGRSKYLIEINTRNKYKRNGEINQRYKWRKGVHPSGDPREHFIAVSIDPDTGFYCVCFGSVQRQPFPSGIPMKESDVKGYECLADNQPRGHEIPERIRAYVKAFRRDHPDRSKTAFIMMRISNNAPFPKITQALRDVLKGHGMTGVRADDKTYTKELFANVETHMHGCGFGIAVFERIEKEDINPNAALEVGYMEALEKPVCLLKDKTLAALQSDLMGHLFEEFDPHDPEGTISPKLGK